MLADFFIERPGENVYFYMAQEMFSDESPEDLKKRSIDVKRSFLAPFYGQSPESLGVSLKVDVATAMGLFNKFAAALPEVGIPKYEFDPDDLRWKRVADQDDNDAIQYPTFKSHTEFLARHTGEATSLFGRKRRFAGLYHLRHCDKAIVRCQLKRRLWEFDVLPLQLWNWTLHSYINQVRDYDTQRVIATTENRGGRSGRGVHEILSKPGMCKWPFRNLSYKSIRTLTIGSTIIQFTPIEDVHRQAVNSTIQMSAADIFKKSIIRVDAVARRHGARMLLNVHDEIVCLVPDASLHGFVRDAEKAMTRPPARWWRIPIEGKTEVGSNYGQMKPYKPLARAYARALPTKERRIRALFSWIKNFLSRVSRWLRVNSL